jgi:hypothetical protein
MELDDRRWSATTPSSPPPTAGPARPRPGKRTHPRTSGNFSRFSGASHRQVSALAGRLSPVTCHARRTHSSGPWRTSIRIQAAVSAGALMSTARTRVRTRDGFTAPGRSTWGRRPWDSDPAHTDIITGCSSDIRLCTHVDKDVDNAAAAHRLVHDRCGAGRPGFHRLSGPPAADLADGSCRFSVTSGVDQRPFGVQAMAASLGRAVDGSATAARPATSGCRGIPGGQDHAALPGAHAHRQAVHPAARRALPAGPQEGWPVEAVRRVARGSPQRVCLP